MSNTPIWSRIDGPNGPSITVIFSTGETSIVNVSHASQGKILQALVNEAPESEIRELINPVSTIAKRLRRLSANVTTDGTNLFLDGEVLDNSLSRYIMRLVREENTNPDAPDWLRFIKFMEKLSQNNSEESRQSLFDFITLHGLMILPDGNFVAFKGVGDDLLSQRSGPGIVNNVVFDNARLNNSPGNVIEIDRSYVNADRDNACSRGLHVTTRAYASTWGSRVLVVSVNPRDVVAVPRGEVQKMRVCRYEVIEETTRETPAWASVDEENVAASTPLYWQGKAPAKRSISDDDVAKLEKATKEGTRLTITYHGKEYNNILVNSVNETHVKISSEIVGYRTFFLNEIDSVEEVAPEEDSELVALRKNLEELRASDEKIDLEYHGSAFTDALVYRVGSTHVTIKSSKGYRTLFLSDVKNVVKSSATDANKEIRAQLEEAVDSGEPVTITYRGNRFENVIVRRLENDWVKIRRVDTGDPGYRTFNFAGVESVEPAKRDEAVELSADEKLIEGRFLKAVENGEDVVLRDPLGRFLSVVPVATENRNGELVLGVKIPSNNDEFEWLDASDWDIYLGGLS